MKSNIYVVLETYQTRSVVILGSISQKKDYETKLFCYMPCSFFDNIKLDSDNNSVLI